MDSVSYDVGNTMQLRDAGGIPLQRIPIRALASDMQMLLCRLPQRQMFGRAISTTFPLRFEDVSNICEVPNHQVFVDPARDESLIIELLEMKHDLADNASATWFLQDLATEQAAEGNIVTEQSAVFEAQGLGYRNIPSVITTATAQMAISKGSQGREAQNLVKVYLANLPLKGVGTDLLIAAYEPVFINPSSESAKIGWSRFNCACCRVGTHAKL